MTSLFSRLVRPRVSTIQTSSLALALYLRLSSGLPVSSAYVRISSVFTPSKISCEKGHWIFRPGMYDDAWDVVFTRSRFPRGKSHVVFTRCCFRASGRVNSGMRAPGSAPVDAPLAAPVDELLLARRWTRQFRPRLSRLSEPLWATADTAVDPGVGIDILQKTFIILNHIS